MLRAEFLECHALLIFFKISCLATKSRLVYKKAQYKVCPSEANACERPLSDTVKTTHCPRREHLLNRPAA
jgi:hypothetical protein